MFGGGILMIYFLFENMVKNCKKNLSMSITDFIQVLNLQQIGQNKKFF